MINRKFFFDHTRSHLFTGKLTPSQVSGLDFILDEWESNHASKDDRWLAYALGTTFHETAFKMQPIHEYGGDANFFRQYDIQSPIPARVVVARRLGNLQKGDGVLFHGRGYVQLTGRYNYEQMGKDFNIDLSSNAVAADRVLDPKLASRIMFFGMENGKFTGKKFADYFHGNTQDWVKARRIINGLDCTEKIAIYAKTFYAAISYTT